MAYTYTYTDANRDHRAAEGRTDVVYAPPVALDECVNCGDQVGRVYTWTDWQSESEPTKRVISEVYDANPSLWGWDQLTWLHVGGGWSCPAREGVKKWAYATIASTCPKCKVRGTLTTTQLAYGNQTTCNADGCTYNSYFSIGD